MRQRPTRNEVIRADVVGGGSRPVGEAAVAARKPLGHPAIIHGIALLFLMRGLQRFIFMEEIAAAVNIEAARNIGNGIVFLVLAILLIVLNRLSAKQESGV